MHMLGQRGSGGIAERSFGQPATAASLVEPRRGWFVVSDSWDQDAAAAFVEQLFARHHGEIYAYLVRMVRDPDRAADLAQDAFVKAYRAYDTLQKDENARAWLYRIAHRVALDDIRHRRVIRFLPFTSEPTHATEPSPERLAMDVRLSGPLERALARIPERQRAALLLAEVHDLTGLELAATLGISHLAARALLTRARESLRQALASEREAERVTESERDARYARRGRASGGGSA
jgi:RNA polymerase sigma-70 factor (ECF subfamily)